MITEKIDTKDVALGDRAGAGVAGAGLAVLEHDLRAALCAHVLRPGRRRGSAAGSIFPIATEPDYWDFVYFSFTLGMTFQTSDVDITSRRVRRVVTGHCLAAFVFNLGVLAFTINSIGGG